MLLTVALYHVVVFVQLLNLLSRLLLYRPFDPYAYEGYTRGKFVNSMLRNSTADYFRNILHLSNSYITRLHKDRSSVEVTRELAA